jgi:hypothetical protein
VRVGRLALEGLRAKYGEMFAMRVLHASGQEDVHAARARMAELASVYPGALREIDDLELDEIRRRIESLDEVLHGRHEVETWMEAVALFHGLARGALCAKRWLRGRKHVDDSVEREFDSAVASLTFPEEARAWRDHLARIASPPRGRLTDLVFARVAEALGTSDKVARRLVFGVPRRERRKT